MSSHNIFKKTAAKMEDNSMVNHGLIIKDCPSKQFPKKLDNDSDNDEIPLPDDEEDALIHKNIAP